MNRDIIHHVFKFVDYQTLCNCYMISKLWREEAKRHIPTVKLANAIDEIFHNRNFCEVISKLYLAWGTLDAPLRKILRNKIALRVYMSDYIWVPDGCRESLRIKLKSLIGPHHNFAL